MECEKQAENAKLTSRLTDGRMGDWKGRVVGAFTSMIVLNFGHFVHPLPLFRGPGSRAPGA